AGITTDIRHAINRFHHLPGPMVSDLADKWKSLAYPTFELGETLRTVLGLSGLVIFAADDEHIALLVARESHVVVRHRPDLLLLTFRSLRRVPKKRVLDRAGYAQTNCHSAVAQRMHY